MTFRPSDPLDVRLGDFMTVRPDDFQADDFRLFDLMTFKLSAMA